MKATFPSVTTATPKEATGRKEFKDFPSTFFFDGALERLRDEARIDRAKARAIAKRIVKLIEEVVAS